MPKFVAYHTLHDATWNSTILSGDVAARWEQPVGCSWWTSTTPGYSRYSLGVPTVAGDRGQPVALTAGMSNVRLLAAPVGVERVVTESIR
jgi:hypothetical protein